MDAHVMRNTVTNFRLGLEARSRELTATLVFEARDDDKGFHRSLEEGRETRASLSGAHGCH